MTRKTKGILTTVAIVVVALAAGAWGAMKWLDMQDNGGRA